MSSRFSDEMSVHSGCRASTISSHSTRARALEEDRRWLKNDFIAAVSGDGEEGMRRTSRPRRCEHVIMSLEEDEMSRDERQAAFK